MISLNDVTLMRDSRVLIADTSLTIHQQHKVGIIGRNGCGKSSLFAAIMGQLPVEKGSLSLPRGLKIAEVQQKTPALTESAIDYVMDGDLEVKQLKAEQERAFAAGDGEKIALIEDKLGIAEAWTLKNRTEMLLHGLGFADAEFNKPVREFSGGWRMRLNLAQALIYRSDLLLLDEPTNHLDLDTVLFLENYLKNYSGTLLCISHDRDFLDSFCTDILHFESGKILLYTGNYSDYERLRAERIKAEHASRRREEAILAHMQAFVDKFRYKATKAKQAQSLIKAMDRMKLTAVTQEESPFSFSFPEPLRTPAVIASLDHVDAGYGKDVILKDVNLQLFAGDRVALLGRNGQGKSTFIKTLNSVIPPLTGSVTLNTGIQVGYFAQQELDTLREDMTILQNLQRLDPNAREKDLRSFLGGFAFSGDMVFQQVATLSGGEQARLALAILAYQRPNLLLLDEPTNHLDLDMREALSVALASYPGALVLVSHDRHLVEAIADKLWLIDDGQIREFDGDIEDYKEYLAKKARDYKAALSAGKPASPPPSAKSYKTREQKQQEARVRESLRPLRLEIEKLERQTDHNRKALEELDARLADPALYQDKSVNMEELMQKRAALAGEIEELELTWLEKQEELEQKQRAGGLI